jgi:hypothetical protein
MAASFASTGLPLILADQRQAEPRGIKAAIFGRSGIGKTSLLWTLPPDTTLFYDLEAGDLAIEGWSGDTIRPRTWEDCRDFAVFIGGPNPAIPDGRPYSQRHFNDACAKFGDPRALDKYAAIFVDSITVAGRLCFQWAKERPEAFSEKTGKPDIRGAYGLHGREMIGWITHLQHTRMKDVFFVGILDEKLDDFNRRVFAPQIDGAKTGLELPGIVDEVLTMTELADASNRLHRVFVCQTLNPWNYPAKDRSGRLDLIEEAHLGRLIAKIGEPGRSPLERLKFSRPAPLAPDADASHPKAQI